MSSKGELQDYSVRLPSLPQQYRVRNLNALQTCFLFSLLNPSGGHVITEPGAVMGINYALISLPDSWSNRDQPFCTCQLGRRHQHDKGLFNH
jgi:hypothetical protein